MRVYRKQPGVTLAEMVVVIAVVAVLVSLAVPAVRSLYDSMGESGGGTVSMISGALASAKAIAIKEQRYAGVRFQKVYRPRSSDPFPNTDDLLNETDVLKADQYMIFIVNDEKTGLDNGFRAVEGINPIKLPASIMVMNFWARTNHGTTDDAAEISPVQLIQTNWLNDNANAYYLRDLSSFSIIFSPSGKLVMHNVRVRGKNKYFRPANTNDSADDIFNSTENIKNNKTGMFIQDDYAYMGLGEEPGQREFVICDKTRFEMLNAAQRYDYLCNELPRIYINRYTGTIVNR